MCVYKYYTQLNVWNVVCNFAVCICDTKITYQQLVLLLLVRQGLQVLYSLGLPCTVFGITSQYSAAVHTMKTECQQ
jgi:hypothetical protein